MNTNNNLIFVYLAMFIALINFSVCSSCFITGNTLLSVALPLVGHSPISEEDSAKSHDSAAAIGVGDMDDNISFINRPVLCMLPSWEEAIDFTLTNSPPLGFCLVWNSPSVFKDWLLTKRGSSLIIFID